MTKGINKNGVIIDLSGEGSDEIFGGYNRYEVHLDRKISNLKKAKNIEKRMEMMIEREEKKR